MYIYSNFVMTYILATRPTTELIDSPIHELKIFEAKVDLTYAP